MDQLCIPGGQLTLIVSGTDDLYAGFWKSGEMLPIAIGEHGLKIEVSRLTYERDLLSEKDTNSSHLGFTQ